LTFGMILMLSLINVGAIPQIAIGDTTHNFTVVPGAVNEITLPIVIKNATDASIKGIQFNMTFNKSVIEILNITEVPIVDVPNMENFSRMENKYCNGTTAMDGLFCFCARTAINTINNFTNASVMVAKVDNSIGVLRIAFASYKNLTDSTATIGKIKMRINASALPNYITTNQTSPLNITVEKMGASHTNYVVNSPIDVKNALSAKIDGLVKACRGDPAPPYGVLTAADALAILRHNVGLENLTSKKECIDVAPPYGVLTAADALAILRHNVGLENLSVAIYQ